MPAYLFQSYLARIMHRFLSRRGGGGLSALRHANRELLFLTFRKGLLWKANSGVSEFVGAYGPDPFLG